MARKPTKISWRGGSATCQFWHPLLQRNIRVQLGDAGSARINRDKLDRIRFDENLWYNLPEDTPEHIVTAWTQNREFAPPERAGEEVERAEAQFWRAQYQLEVQARKALEREVGELRGRRYGSPDVTLGAAQTTFLATLKKSPKDKDHRDDTRFIVNALVRHFGATTPLGDLANREPQLRAWIEARRGKEGGSLTIGRMRQIRMTICRFLEDSGLRIDRVAFKGWRERGEQQPITWMSDEEVAAQIERMGGPGNYWADLFSLQCQTGLRPTEIPTLKILDVDLDRGVLTLSEGGGDLTLKQGSRTIPLSETAKEILKRRIAAAKDGFLFPADRGKRWCNQKYFCRFYNRYLQVTDARMGRRTAGSLWLRAGMRVEHVAALLGDDPKTVRRCYARILSHEVTLPTSGATSGNPGGPSSAGSRAESDRQ